MKAWILSVTAACLFLALIDVFLSEGVTKKYTIGVLRLGVFVLLFVPILNFFSDKENFFSSFIDNESNETMVENADYKTISTKNEFFRAICENELNKSGISCTVTIEEAEGVIEYVNIYSEETVINENEGNIYKNSKTVIEIVTTYLPAEKEQIRVWVK